MPSDVAEMISVPSRQGFRMSRTEATAIGVLLVIYAFSVLDRQILALLVESIKKDLHLTDVQFSALQGIAFALFYGVFALPIGWAIDKHSRRWVIYLGVTCWSVATAACGLARSFSQLFLARAMVGAGEASLGPAAQSILADLFPPERLSLAMSLFVLGAGVGTGSAFLLGGPLVDMVSAWGTVSLPGIGALAPWRTVMLLVGLPGLLVALATFLLPETRRRLIASSTPGSGRHGYGSFLRAHRGFLLAHHGGFGFLYVALLGVQLWMPAYMSRSFHWTPGESGMWMGSIMVLAALIGLPIHGWLVDRLFRKGAQDAHMLWYGWMSLAAAPVAVLTFLSGSQISSIIGYALFYLLLVGGPSIGPTALQIVAPASLRGKLAATYMLVTGLVGSALGPMAVATFTDAILKDENGLGVSLAVVGGVATTLAGLLLLSGRSAMIQAVSERQGSSCPDGNASSRDIRA